VASLDRGPWLGVLVRVGASQILDTADGKRSGRGGSITKGGEGDEMIWLCGIGCLAAFLNFLFGIYNHNWSAAAGWFVASVWMIGDFLIKLSDM
jgi:hypothetical protein